MGTRTEYKMTDFFDIEFSDAPGFYFHHPFDRSGDDLYRPALLESTIEPAATHPHSVRGGPSHGRHPGRRVGDRSYQLLIHRLAGWLRRKKPMAEVALTEKAHRIDLADERVSAQDLPPDQWMTMALDLLNRNDYRHALRALYLSVLALLSDHQRVTIARHKSNLEYARELLARHSHAEPELLAAFDWCMHLFERVW